ncbi:response regulator [Mariniphaga sediminis]|uniref:histidine kinase n=1 Tax=Mariniphaga sediminis TaxID=1628158 RepID=A0A399D5Z6_9BACT|nr:ATP-binding protein [Mariniphaga sediminis]RIH65860.1 response regulator [Mariniphaga sediminis]
MNEPIIIGLIQNIAVLMAFAMLYENFWLKNEKPRSLPAKLFTGIILGGIGIVLMFTPWTLMPGLVFDTRSVMLSVSGVFFGVIPTVIAMVFTMVARFFMDGEGMWMGMAVILVSGTIGLLWAELRKNKQPKYMAIEFLALGLVVHIMMLATTVFLPSERIMPTLKTIVLPVFFIYTPGTMLLGLLLAGQKRNFQNLWEKEKLYESERKLSTDLIKKQKELQEQVEKYSRLNHEFQEQNIELQQAKEKAEESDHLKSAFLANLSHEIRTPMNAIMGFTELLTQDELTTEEREEFIDIVRESGFYLLSIINDIVEISHIDVGQIELKESEIDLQDFLTHLYQTYAVSPTKEKEVKFSLEMPEPPPKGKMITDEVKLRQILINLLNNAIKSTPQGQISFGYQMEKADKISFFVKDSGVGISPDNHQLIFERFRQIETDLSKRASGSGLGLSITKAYVELMGGTIEVDSEIGKGSTFTVTLPFVESSEQVTPQGKSLSADLEKSKDSKLILVAEDEDINWFFISKVLSKGNYKLIRAVNGKEAVEYCKKNPDISLVLMDIKMPEMNGFEALEEIRKIKPKLPVIGQTAYALPGDVEQLKAVFDDYITKPIDRKLLIEKIEENL